MAWLAAAALTLGAYQQTQAAKANNKLSDQNARAATTSWMYENRALNEQERQQQEIDSDRKMDAMKQALKAQGQLKALPKNVSGAVEGTSREIGNDLGNFIKQLSDNAAGRNRQLSMSKKGTTASAQSRINSMPKTRYNPTADIVSTGLSIYGGYKSAQRSNKKAGNGDLSFGQYVRGDWK